MQYYFLDVKLGSTTAKTIFFIPIFLDAHYSEAGTEVISKKLAVTCIFPTTSSKELTINQSNEISIITCQATI